MKSLQKNKTKLLLNQALIELLQEKDFEHIKLNEICEKALVHKTTFYNHFQDKYELLNYLIKNIEKDILNKNKDIKNINEYFLNITKEFINNIKHNSKFWTKILSNNQNGICTNIIYNTIIQNFKETMKNKVSYIPINYISLFYVNAIFSVIIEWVTTGMKDKEEDIILYIENLLTNKYRLK